MPNRFQSSYLIGQEHKGNYTSPFYIIWLTWLFVIQIIIWLHGYMADRKADMAICHSDNIPFYIYVVYMCIVKKKPQQA
jgi:hypothetical protein